MISRFGFLKRVAGGVGVAVAAPVARALAPVAPAVERLEPNVLGTMRMTAYVQPLGPFQAGSAPLRGMGIAVPADGITRTFEFGSEVTETALR